ncbi:hypothetical protein V8E36_009900 [Tilletia maclaganii]
MDASTANEDGEGFSIASGTVRLAKADDYTLKVDEFTCQLLNQHEQPQRIYKEHLTGTKVTCFVEAEEGDRFMGGKWVGGFCHNTGDGEWTATHRWRTVAQDTVQPFLFAPARVTDDDQTGVKDITKVAAMADVTLEVRRLLDATPVELSSGDDSDLFEGDAAHEKAVKVGTVAFSTGPSQRGFTSRTAFTSIDDPLFPPIEFVFHCVTKLGLRIHATMPAERHAHRLQGDHKPADLTPQPSAGPSSSATPATPAPVSPQKRPLAKREQEEEEDAEIENDLEIALVRQKIQRIRDERAALARESESCAPSQPAAGLVSSNTGARAGSTRPGNMDLSYTVKYEPRQWDFSHGGTAQNPVEIDDDDD